eukprot:UN22034
MKLNKRRNRTVERFRIRTLRLTRSILLTVSLQKLPLSVHNRNSSSWKNQKTAIVTQR